ncbi:MAG TPA: hypothetical protein VN258_14920 [Mobilitalea sp.]|nr:hypothetical protein [Mobilitalea sp.]
MAKIAKIRFVNFIYNENRHIYDQTFDFYQGDNALLNLQNGGGKTVLVQMMMQPIVPKQKLKDRLFKNYFINSKAPCYIMIEWLLDNSPLKVMTGIGVKQVASKNPEEESDSLKLITFLSQYEGESNYDIRNIELLEKEKGIVRLHEFDKVIKNLSNAEKEGSSVWLYRWDSPEDKKEYTRRLLEYGINPLEWKNLMVKINESEAGLNSFFNDCKTANALIKKWFLPTMEEQLNKNGDFIQNIKDLIQNHAVQLVKNESMIKEREIFDSFRYRSQELVSCLDSYGTLREKAEQNKSDLGNAYLYVRKEINSLTYQKEEFLRLSKQNDEDMRELEYEKLSGEYHEIANSLRQLKEHISLTEEKMHGLRTDSMRQEYKRRVLHGIRCKAEWKEISHKIAKFEAELEKENLQQEDKRAIIEDLEYSLQQKYQDRIAQYEEKLNAEKGLSKEKNTDLVDTLLNYEKHKKNITLLQEELLVLRSRIAVYEEREKEFRKLYPDYLPRLDLNTDEDTSDSLAKLGARLEQEEAELLRLLLENEDKQEENKATLAGYEKETRELEEKNQNINILRNKAEAAFQAYDTEKGAIVKILKAHQLSEESLFDKERILSLLHSEAEKYSKLIQDRFLDNTLLEQKQYLYLSGKVFELPKQLRASLEAMDILAEYGYEWLRSLSDHKKDKQRIVRNNPFLPYSLILSKEDRVKLQNMELGETLTTVIPILEREKLETMISTKQGKVVYNMGNIDFLIHFDDRILNKNYLKEVVDELAVKMNKNKETIAQAQEALKNTEFGIIKIEGFHYTATEVEKLEKDILDYERESKLNAQSITDLQLRGRELTQSLSITSKQYVEFQNKRLQFDRRKEDTLGLLSRYESVCLDMAAQRSKTENLQGISTAILTLEKDLSVLREELHEKQQLIASLTELLNKDRNNYQNYRDAKPAKLIEEDLEQLESRRNVLIASTSGRLQNLQDILEDYRHRRSEKEKELRELQLEEGFDIGKEFREAELDMLLVEIKENNHRLNLLSEEKNTLQLSVAEKNSDLRYVEKHILEQCGYEEAKDVSYLQDIDYVKEREHLLTNQKNIEKQISKLKLQESSLQRVMFSLEEYEAFAALVTSPYDINDMGEYVASLIKKNKEYESRIVNSRSGLAAYYQKLEAEFITKAELFKGLFQSILEGEKRFQPVHALNAINRVYLQIDRKLEQHSIDLKKIDEMERCIIDNTISYLNNVYDEMNGLDRNSMIEVDGRRCKMLLIELPEKSELDTISLGEYVRNTIIKCEDLYRQGKSMDGLLMNEISTYDLFDRYVGMNKIHLNLMKIEPNRLKKKSWKQVIEENSGGERFVNAFVVFISLLTYMRGEKLLGDDMDSKVLIMDNPFGPITSEHLLKPLFEIAMKYNTQLICLSDLKEHTIFDRFNLIYSLNIEREVGRDEEYIELKTIKKDVLEGEDEVISASMFRIEDRSRFELMN